MFTHIELQEHCANVDWQALSALYGESGMGAKPAERLKVVFENSMYKCFAFHEGTLVGVGRCLADGYDCAYICDIAVLPRTQGIGLGKRILTRLLALSAGHKKRILYAVPGKEGFYASFGFAPMLTAMAIFQDQPAAAQRGYVLLG